MKKFLTILFTLCLWAATALAAPVQLDIYSVNDGTALQPDKFYRVAVNDFLLDGGDGYTSIKNVKIPILPGRMQKYWQGLWQKRRL